MELNTEKQAERGPLSVRLSDDEWERLAQLQDQLGVGTRSDVVKWMINRARVRRASLTFAQPESQPN
jgi:hypothetical protein